MRHLTDEEIQAYLDGTTAEYGTDLKDHLETCKRCRKVLGEYRAIYAGLADETGFEVPPQLAHDVISNLGLKRSRRRFSLSGDVVLVSCAIVATLIGASIFLDLRPLLDATSAVGRSILEYALSPLESADDHLTDGTQSLSIFAAGIGILFFMSALDTVFKLRRRVFSKNDR